jgi:5-deoxy-glucuronate isomerase
MTGHLYVPEGATGTPRYALDGEWIVLPLSGGCTVHTEGNKEDKAIELLGRVSVFAEVTDFAHTPRDARVQIASGAGGHFALAGAKCERRLPARYGPAPEVPDPEQSRPALDRQADRRVVRAAQTYESGGSASTRASTRDT